MQVCRTLHLLLVNPSQGRSQSHFSAFWAPFKLSSRLPSLTSLLLVWRVCKQIAQPGFLSQTTSPCAEAPCFLVVSPLLCLSGCAETFLGGAGSTALSLPPAMVINALPKATYLLLPYPPSSLRCSSGHCSGAAVFECGSPGIAFLLMGDFGAWE